MTEERNTIAAVVVTYNRKQCLCENLDMLLKQDYPIDSIIIVDNCSSDGTEKLIRETFADHIDRIDYNYLQKNVGGAGGFEYGLRRAYDKGYGLIWLMDDDGRPCNNETLRVLIDQMSRNELEHKPFVLNSLVVANREDLLTFKLEGAKTIHEAKRLSRDGLFRVNGKTSVAPFNGTLVSRELVGEIGYPNPALFISGDELDYVFRALKSGAFMGTATESLYYHPRANYEKKKFLWKTIYVGGDTPPWKYYYTVRNGVFSAKQNKQIARVIIRPLKWSFICCYRDRGDRSTCFKYILQGTRDGLAGRLGDRVHPPRG